MQKRSVKVEVVIVEEIRELLEQTDESARFLLLGFLFAKLLEQNAEEEESE